MSVIKSASHLHGARFWAVWYEWRIPRFEVFEYIGYRPDTGEYYFKGLKERVIISRGIRQLAAPTFRPFCYDTKKIFGDGNVPAA